MKSIAASVEDYLTLRRNAGFKMRHESTLLPGLARFLKERGARHLTLELAMEFATRPKDVQRFQWANRLRMVRGFARFRSVEDRKTQVPPPGMLRSAYHRRAPTIISDADLRRLIAAARALPTPVGLRPHTYATLLGLLAATGMRRGEAIALQDRDVDFAHEVITVRESKGRTRIVPIHPSAAGELQRYRATRTRLLRYPRDQAFFIGDAGRALTSGIFTFTFCKLWKQIAREDQPTIRAHGLRHRFVVRTIEGWYRDGKPIEPRMEALSTYLGHANPKHTYWYLTATPELLGLAQKRLRKSVDLRP